MNGPLPSPANDAANAALTPAPALADTPPPFRVLTLNIHKGFSSFNRRFVLHELREAIRSTAADVVFLQEVLGEHQGHRRRHAIWPEQPQYEFLADSIWKQHAYGRNAVYTEGHHGNAVLSKFPILRFDNHDVSSDAESPERRGILHCELQLPAPSPSLHVCCVHLGLFEKDRRRQLERLCELVEREVPPESPLVVAGDFNDWRLRAHEALKGGAGLREVYVETVGEAARSFPAGFPLLRLDRIYFRGLRQANPVLVPRAPWKRLSDHLPLSAEFAP